MFQMDCQLTLAVSYLRNVLHLCCCNHIYNDIGDKILNNSTGFLL